MTIETKIRYETSDGQKRDETGTLKDAPPTPENPNNKVIDIIGSYEFTTPEGKTNCMHCVRCDVTLK